VFYESEAGLRYFLGMRDAPMPEVQVAAGPSPVTSDAGAAFGMYPKAIVKRKPNVGLEPDINPFARVISKGANWLADQVDKGATLYDTMQLIIPGGFDPDTKLTVNEVLDAAKASITSWSARRPMAFDTTWTNSLR